MTLTRSQLHERITDLSGQYRAAQENKRLTSAKREEQERLTDLARQADEKADEHLARVRADVNAATIEYAGAVDEFLDGPAEIAGVIAAVSDDPRAARSDETHGAHFGDFGHPTQNGLDVSAVNAAYDRSTHP